MRLNGIRLTMAGMALWVGLVAVGTAQGQGSPEGKTSDNDSTSNTSQFGSQGAGRPTAGEIVTRMLVKNRERLAALEHYESDRTYRVEYKGTGGEHHAELRVHAEYTGPDRKQLTVVGESGSKFICDKVLRKLVEGEQEAAAESNRVQTTLGPENYSAVLVGEETVGTGAGSVRTWVLQVTPKVDNKFTYNGRVWVSEEDYAVVRIVGEPAKSPSWWINRASLRSDYVRRGDVWLPAKNVSSSHVRIGGEATLTIDYGTYPVVAARALRPETESAENRAPAATPLRPQ